MELAIYQVAFTLTMLFSGSDAKSIGFSGQPRVIRANEPSEHSRISQPQSSPDNSSPSERIESKDKVSPFEVVQNRKMCPTERSDLPGAPKIKLNFRPKLRFRRYATGPSWYHSVVTWYVPNFTWWTPPLTHTQVKETMAKAFQMWSEVCPLQFRYQDPPVIADIEITFGSWWHNQCPSPFDGPGGVYAHAFFPGSRRYDGDIHFDVTENWNVDGSQPFPKISFFYVAVHEIGHSLGLKHSHVPSSIMYATYRHTNNVILHNDDINGIQSLYGKCNPSKISSMCESLNYRTHIVVGDYYWALDDQNRDTVRGYPRPVTEVMPNLGYPIDEMFVWPGNKETYIFKGHWYWKYNVQSKSVLGHYYPLRIERHWPGVQAPIDAATNWDNDYSYFFKGTTVFRYNSTSDSVDRSSTIASEFPNLPRNLQRIDTAFKWTTPGGDHQVYLFSGDKFWKTTSLNPPVFSAAYSINDQYHGFQTICVP